MKKILVMMLVLILVFPASCDYNITTKWVRLSERGLEARFHNLGVDAYWADFILNTASDALPFLEEYLGIPFPNEVEAVEIYGEKRKDGGIFVGFNNGKRIVLEEDHPNPHYIIHELVHYWTIYYNIPHALSEGYPQFYSYLDLREFDYHEVADSILFHDGVLFGIATKEVEREISPVLLNSFENTCEFLIASKEVLVHSRRNQ